MNLFVIEVLPSPSVPESKVGYDTLKIVPQTSVLTPLLFNIYTYDLTVAISRKFAYADDLAILPYESDWQALEGTLCQDTQSYSFIFTNGSSSSLQQRLSQLPSIFTTRKHSVSLTSLSIDRAYCFVLNPLILA